MVRSEHTGKEYAIKFFISKRAFEDELNWYQPPKSLEAGDLIQFLPQVRFSHALFQLSRKLYRIPGLLFVSICGAAYSHFIGP